MKCERAKTFRFVSTWELYNANKYSQRACSTGDSRDDVDNIDDDNEEDEEDEDVEEEDDDVVDDDVDDDGDDDDDDVDVGTLAVVDIADVLDVAIVATSATALATVATVVDIVTVIVIVVVVVEVAAVDDFDALCVVASAVGVGSSACFKRAMAPLIWRIHSWTHARIDKLRWVIEQKSSFYHTHKFRNLFRKVVGGNHNKWLLRRRNQKLQRQENKSKKKHKTN